LVIRSNHTLLGIYSLASPGRWRSYELDFGWSSRQVKSRLIIKQLEANRGKRDNYAERFGELVITSQDPTKTPILLKKRLTKIALLIEIIC
jgi:hypothetical protein